MAWYKPKDWYSKGKTYVRRSADKGKDYGRRASVPLKKAQPYVAGAVTFITTVAGAPWIGAAYGALEGAVAAPYIGSTAARQEGKSGSDAREAGRDQRKKVTAAAAVGLGAGLLTSLSVSLLSGPGAAPAGTISSSTIGAGATKSAIIGAGIGAPAGVGAGIGAPLGIGAAAGTTSLVSSTVAAASSGGILSTIGDVLGVGKDVLAVAGPVLGLAKPPIPTEDGFMEGLLAGLLGGGGAGGAGGAAGSGPVDEGGANGAFVPASQIPTWVKVAGGGLVLAGGGFLVHKLMRKAG